MRSQGGCNGRISETRSQPPAQPMLMHSQCFLVLHQREGWELVKLWAASGTFPVVDRRGEQQRLRWAACRDSHFISRSAHRHSFTGRAAITSQIHRRRGSTDTEPLTNGPETGAAPQVPQVNWLPPSRVWLKKTALLFIAFSPDLRVSRRCYGFVLHGIG